MLNIASSDALQLMAMELGLAQAQEQEQGLAQGPGLAQEQGLAQGPGVAKVPGLAPVPRQGSGIDSSPSSVSSARGSFGGATARSAGGSVVVSARGSFVGGAGKCFDQTLSFHEQMTQGASFRSKGSDKLKNKGSERSKEKGSDHGSTSGALAHVLEEDVTQPPSSQSPHQDSLELQEAQDSRDSPEALAANGANASILVKSTAAQVQFLKNRQGSGFDLGPLSIRDNPYYQYSLGRHSTRAVESGWSVKPKTDSKPAIRSVHTLSTYPVDKHTLSIIRYQINGPDTLLTYRINFSYHTHIVSTSHIKTPIVCCSSHPSHSSVPY